MKYLFNIIVLLLWGCSGPSDKSDPDIEKQVSVYNQKYMAYQRVNTDTAQLYIDSIEMISKPANYTFGIGIAALNKGLLEQVKGNFNLAISHNEKALLLFTGLKYDTLMAKTLAALGTNYWQKGENDKALQYLFKALKINETLNTKKEKAACYNQISMVYQSQDKIKLAEEFAGKSMDIIAGMPPDLTHISTLHNLANIYGMQGKYADALRLDSIGLSYCEKLNVKFNKSMFYDNMANCFYFSKQFPKSVEYHLKANSIDSSFRNNKQMGDTYCNLGILYEEFGNSEQAIAYYLRSLELCKESGYKIGVKNALGQLSKLYFRLNKPAEAFQMQSESILYKDSVINEASEQKIAELQTLFDTEKKKQQIAQQELKINKRNILLFVLMAAFMLTIFIFRLIYYRYKFQQERKLQQELIKEEAKRSSAILESEENERQRLARELHDGVGQLLSASKLNLSALSNNHCTDEEKQRLQYSMDILDDSIREIRNISHNMVPDVLLKHGLQRAVKDFISRINIARKINIHFESNGFEEDMLDETGKLMLYRIIQESVNNAMKYAEASNINIQLSADIHEISLLMEDNGKGFDVMEAKQKGGIGLKNIQLRTEYLKGKLEIESSPQNGTTIIIEIPLS